MSDDHPPHPTDRPNTPQSYRQRLIGFWKWFLVTGLRNQKFAFLLIGILLIAAALLGLFVSPHWVGWLLGMGLAFGVLLFSIFDYMHQIVLGINENSALRREELLNRILAEAADNLKKYENIHLILSNTVDAQNEIISRLDTLQNNIEAQHLLIGELTDARATLNTSASPEALLPSKVAALQALTPCNFTTEVKDKIIERLESLQSDIQALQSAIPRVDAVSQEITDVKQSTYYLVAATDELRKIYNAYPRNQG